MHCIVFLVNSVISVGMANSLHFVFYLILYISALVANKRVHSMRSRVYVTVGCTSVRPSVCLSDQRAAGLLQLGAPRAGDIDRQRRAPACSNGAAAASAGSVTFTAAVTG